MDTQTDALRDRVGDWLEQAQAMEQRVLRELDVAISALKHETTFAAAEDLGAGELVRLFEGHRAETETHAGRLAERLDAMGRSTSRFKQVKSQVTGAVASFMEISGADRPARHACDAFAAEHMEIAIYEVLERLAQRAGDGETAEVARLNREDELRMAERIAERWDEVLEITVASHVPVGSARDAG